MASYNWGEYRIINCCGRCPPIRGNATSGSFSRSTASQVPKETYDYVFYIVSAAVIGENPRLFGFPVRQSAEVPRTALSAGPSRSQVQARHSHDDNRASGRMLHPWRTHRPSISPQSSTGCAWRSSSWTARESSYQNPAAVRLRARLRKEYQADLVVMLRYHLLRSGDFDPAAPGSRLP